MSEVINFAKPAYSLGGLPNNPALNYYHDVDLELLPEGRAFADFAAETIKAQEAFSEERQRFDTRMTKDANLDRVEKLADGLNDATTKRREKLDASLKHSALMVDEAYESATFCKAGPQAAEIRGVFLKADPAERDAMLRAAFAEDDRTVIGAIIGFHKLTHGVRPEVLAAEHDAWRQRTAPREYARVAEMKKLLSYHHNVGMGQLRYYADSKKGTLGHKQAESEARSVLSSYGVDYDDK